MQSGKSDDTKKSRPLRIAPAPFRIDRREDNLARMDSLTFPVRPGAFPISAQTEFRN